jgi:hypothetical protein
LLGKSCPFIHEGMRFVNEILGENVNALDLES